MKIAKRPCAIIVAMVLLLWGDSAKAQILGRPEMLCAFDSRYGYIPPIFRDPTKKGSGEIPWVVYADRNGTRFFHDERCNRPKRQSAKFMQRFFVKKISDDRNALFLVDADLEPNLSDVLTKTEYGWAKKDEVLLTNMAYKALDNHITRKALIATDYRPFSDVGYKKARHAVLYDRPSLETPPIKNVGLTKFGYVYKTIEESGSYKWYLISDKTTRFFLNIDHEMQEKEKAFGWIRSDEVRIWNTRDALELIAGRKMPVHIYRNLVDLIQGRSEGIVVHDRTGRKEPLENSPLVVFDILDEYRYPTATVPIAIARVGYFPNLTFSKDIQNPPLESSRGCIEIFPGCSRRPSAKKKASSENISTEGWVRLEDDQGNALARRLLLFNRDDLAEVINVLDGLVVAGAGAPEVLAVWKKVIQATMGESEKNDSIADVVKKRLGIAFPVRQKLFRKPIDQITEAEYQDVLDVRMECAGILKKLRRHRDTPDNWFLNFEEEYTWIATESILCP